MNQRTNRVNYKLFIETQLKRFKLLLIDVNF